MKPLEFDENGLILVNDAMSEELKQKIASYNALYYENIGKEFDEDVEEPVEEDIDDEDLIDDDEDFIEGVPNAGVNDSNIDELNDMFS